MRTGDFGRLLLLAAIWGLSFLFIRVAVPVLGPLPLADARCAIAAAALLIYAVAVGRYPDFRRRWRQYTVVAFLNNVVPFTLIMAAELHLTAGLAAILNATTPLFTAVAAAIWLHDPMTRRRGVGLFLGLVGVGLIVGWSHIPLGLALVFSVGASLLAAASYAASGVYIKTAFAGESPFTLATAQLALAAIFLLPLSGASVAVQPIEHLTGNVLLCVTALAVVCSSVAYLLYFRLIADVGPTAALSVTFMVPAFGLLWGAIFLHEPITIGTIGGFAAILTSIRFVAGRLPPSPSRAVPAHVDAASEPRVREVG